MRRSLTCKVSRAVPMNENELVITQRTGTIVCRLDDAHCRRVGYRYDWDVLEESPGFDCQPLDVGKIEKWREAIANELNTSEVRRINANFIKELGWLKYLYIDFAMGRLKCDASMQRRVALWMIEVDTVKDLFLTYALIERGE